MRSIPCKGRDTTEGIKIISLMGVESLSLSKDVYNQITESIKSVKVKAVKR